MTALIESRIRAIPDFPRPGILYRDLTPLLADGQAFAATIDALARIAGDYHLIAGIEARGLGVALVAGVAAWRARRARVGSGRTGRGSAV